MDRTRRLFSALVLVGAILVPAQSRAAGTTTISFAVAGDHGANSNTAASLKKLDASGVDFYLAIGDLDYKEVPSPTAWCDYVKARTPTLGPNFPFQLLAGNHEERTIQEHAACLPDRLNSTLRTPGSYPTEYFFDYPASAPLVRVVMISPALVINSVAYTYSAGSSRYNWVADAIDGARREGVPWVVVGMHKHCITPGSSSCEIGADLMNLLAEKKVDLVLQGHDHTYRRGKQLALNTNCSSVARFNVACIVDEGTDNNYTKGRGTIVLINGMFGKGGSSSAGGYFVRAGSGDGFTKFTMTADRIDATFVNATTTFADSYSILPNQPPQFPSIGDQDHRETETVTVPFGAVDPEGDPVTYTATGLPPGLAINKTTGAVAGTIPEGSTGGSPYSVHVTATDSASASSTLQFLWFVRDLTAPATPASLTIARHTTGLLLDWPDNTEIDFAGYNILRSSATAGPFTKLNDSLLTGSSYFDQTAAPGATSYYQIAALDRQGNISPPRTGNAFRSKIVFVSSSRARGSGMTMRISRPAGAGAGSVLIAGIAVRGSVTVLPPPGWTLVSQVSHTGAMTHQAIFRRTVGSGEPSSYTFHFVGRSSAIGMIAAYRGALDRPARSGGQANPSSKSIAAPSISSTVAHSVLVGLFGTSADTSITAPLGMMERAEHNLSSGPLRAALQMADGVVAAQTLGARVATASTAAGNIGQVVVLSPAP